MIRIKDNWCVDINNDEIDVDELIQLVIEESVDLSLPIAHLSFRTKDIEKVNKYSSKDYKVTLGLGRTDIETKMDTVVFSREIRTYQGNNQWSVDVYLAYDQLDYININRMETYNTTEDLKKSSEVFEKVCKRNSLKPLTIPSNDKMLWLQYNISDRFLLEEVLTHGWFNKQDPVMFGIRRNGEAVYKPISSLLNPKMSFGQGDVDILVNDYGLKSKANFLSSWVGGKRITPKNLQEEGIFLETKTDVKDFMSGSTGLSLEVTRFSNTQFENDNVHKHWLEAYSQNIQGRASMSSVYFPMVTYEEYKDIYVLDCLESSFINPDNKQPLYPLMGNWIVTNIQHRIVDNEYACTFIVSREQLKDEHKSFFGR